MNRFFCPIVININDEVILDSSISHHIEVLRLKSHDSIVLFNGSGGAFVAEILDIKKKKVTVKILSFQSDEKNDAIELHLGQCLIANDKMDLIIQKAVELGVSSITPIYSEWTQHINPARIEQKLSHWQNVIIHACQQCGQNFLPKIFSPISLSEWTKNITAKQKIILDPYMTSSVEIKNIFSVALLVGPEAGFSKPDLEIAKKMVFNLGKSLKKFYVQKQQQLVH